MAKWRLWGEVLGMEELGMEESADEVVLYERGGGLELEVEEVEVVGVGVVLREMKGGHGVDVEADFEDFVETLRLCAGGVSEALRLLRDLRQELA
jgi:hypothetical protein